MVHDLYNNILIKSRNIELFYKNNLQDNLQNKIIILLIHFSFIFNKSKNRNSKVDQKLFDYIFLKIETDLREIGFGDMLINKKMKIIINKFYSILIEFNGYLNKSIYIKNNLMNKLFNLNKSKDLDYFSLVEYFDNFAKKIDLISLDDIYDANF